MKRSWDLDRKFQKQLVRNFFYLMTLGLKRIPQALFTAELIASCYLTSFWIMEPFRDPSNTFNLHFGCGWFLRNQTHFVKFRRTEVLEDDLTVRIRESFYGWRNWNNVSFTCFSVYLKKWLVQKKTKGFILFWAPWLGRELCCGGESFPGGKEWEFTYGQLAIPSSHSSCSKGIKINRAIVLPFH